MEEVTQTIETNVTPENIENSEVAKIESKENEIKTETKVPEEKKEPEFMSEKFAALARKEKALVKQRQEIAAQKLEMEKNQKTISERLSKLEHYERLRENAKLDPDSVLNEFGLSYGGLTERNLKGGIDPQAILEKTNQTIEKFRKEQEEEKKKQLEEQQTLSEREYEQRVANFVEGISQYVKENQDSYELINQTGQQNLIWEVIQEGARRGQDFTVKQASDKVETYLSEQVEKALNAKKFKDKFTKVVKEESPKPGIPTLTNQMTSSTPSKGNRIPTEQERIQNAMNVLNKFD